MPVEIGIQKCVSIGATRLVTLDYTDDLPSGVLLTGTPTVVEVDTSNLTLANKALNSATFTYEYEAGSNRTVAVSAAVQFTVTTSTTGKYKIRITVVTDGTPAETLVYDYPIEFA